MSYYGGEMAAVILPQIITTITSSLFGIFVSSLLGIVLYVFSSLGLYTMAQRRGIRHAWLAWVPVANLWVLGSLSDQYQYVVRGQNKSKRKLLLTLKILEVLLTLAILVASGYMLTRLFFNLNYLTEDLLFELVMGPLLGILGLVVVFSGLCIALAILRYMALYDVYRSLDPDNSVMYLVLSILFNVTEPFFLFFNRHKDGGMPPRKTAYEAPLNQTWNEPKDYL